jgi:two-component system, sensor histidine kinase
MSERALSKLLREQAPLAGALALSVALLAASIDWITWIELNVSLVYSLPLVIVFPTRRRRLLWGMTAFLLVVTFAVYALQIPPGRFSPLEHFFVDRLLSASTLLMVAFLLHFRMAALDTIEAQRRTLTRQNEELDRRRRDAEEAVRRKTRVLAAASHDLRTPVYAIRLMAEVVALAARAPSLATQVPDLVERLQANAGALDRLISDLLDVASIDLGRITVQESSFSLDDLLVEQCGNLLPLSDAKQLRLEVGASDQPTWLRTDREKLARVLSNLLGNAIKFTRNGSITVSVSQTPELVLIRVRDTGVGIAAEHLEHIFDEFAQLQNEAVEHAGGSGLGLAICRRLMEALGGSITVESELGQGSVFTASLPSRCHVDGAHRAPQVDQESASTPVTAAQ